MSANDTQVAGNHYRVKGDKIQHWDLSIMFGWDPFQYQITKYVMRWKYKHATPEERLQDLLKARHFLDKYIECYRAFDSGVGEEPESTPKVTDKRVATAEAEVALAPGNFTIEGYFGDETQHYKCVHCRAVIRAKTLADAFAQHGGCAQAHSMFTHP